MTSLPCALTLNTLSKNAEYKVKLKTDLRLHTVMCLQGTNQIIAFPVVEAKILVCEERLTRKATPQKQPTYSTRNSTPMCEQAFSFCVNPGAYDEQVTIAEEGCIPAIVTLLRSSEDVPTQYHALMTLCR